MKKIYILTAAVIMAFGLSACGSKDAHTYKRQSSSKAENESKADTSSVTEDDSVTDAESSEAVTEDSDSSAESKAADSKAEKKPKKTTSKPATDPDGGKSYVFDDPEGEVAIAQNDDGTITVAIPSNGITNEEANYSDHHIVKKEEVKSEENSDMTYLTFDEDYFNTVAQNNINSSKETLDDLIANGLDAYETVTDITYNEEFTDFTIQVKSREAFEKSSDKEITAVIEQAASIYHTYSLHEDVTFTFRFVDADGNEFLKEMIAG